MDLDLTPDEPRDLEAADDIALADRLKAGREDILSELHKLIIGQGEVIEQALLTLFVGGNSLIVGVPGLAKTLLIQTMAQVLDLTFNRIQHELAAALPNLTDNRVLFLLLVQIVFFLIGIVMDGTPALLILVPILMPIAVNHYGIEPIHFGILVEANVALGLVTPPVGLCLYAACAVSRLPLESVIRPLLPMIAVLVVTMLLITYVQGFAMFLPRLLGLVE